MLVKVTNQMPCTKCNCSVKGGAKRGCRVRYCRCGLCNHCHLGGLCPGWKFWYKQKRENKPNDHRERMEDGQSHGGHGFIPGCKKCNRVK